MREIWEVQCADGSWVIEDWPKLQSAQLAKLESKLDMLRSAEVDPKTGMVGLPQGLLAGPNVYGQKWIYKLKIRGNVALRPMLCLGPVSRESEWTVLARAVEKGDVLIPADAANVAEERRGAIINGTAPRQIFGEGEK